MVTPAWTLPGFDPRNAFADCPGRALRYRRLIDIENLWTATEMQGLWDARASLPEEMVPLVEKTVRMMHAGGRPPRSWNRSALSDNVTLYREDSAPAGSDRLLLCFCGHAGRMMLPAAVFLDHVPDTGFEVVLLRDPTLSQFLRGVPDYADDPAGLLARLSADLGLARYREVAVMGSSGGGAAALYSAILLGAARGISIGGRHPTTAGTAPRTPPGTRPPSGLEFDEMLASHGDRPHPPLVAVFGEHHAEDSAGAASLRQRLPGCRFLRIAGLDRHEVLPHLLRHGRLGEFMRGLLAGEAAPNRRSRP